MRIQPFSLSERLYYNSASFYQEAESRPIRGVAYLSSVVSVIALPVLAVIDTLGNGILLFGINTYSRLHPTDDPILKVYQRDMRQVTGNAIQSPFKKLLPRSFTLIFIPFANKLDQQDRVTCQTATIIQSFNDKKNAASLIAKKLAKLSLKKKIANGVNKALSNKNLKKRILTKWKAFVDKKQHHRVAEKLKESVHLKKTSTQNKTRKQISIRRWEIEFNDLCERNSGKNRAAKKIQRFWKKNSCYIDSTGQVGKWLLQHYSDYVAHAIWPSNVDKVMQSGAVKSSEAVLRETGEVEYESGYGFGMRGTASLIQIPKQLETQMRQSPPKISFRHRGYDKIDVNVSNYLKSYDPKPYLQAKEKLERKYSSIYSWTHGECEELWKLAPLKAYREYEETLKFKDFIAEYEKSQEYRNELAKKKWRFVPEFHIALKWQHFSKAPIDEILAHHYEACIKSGVLSQKEAYNECSEVRKDVLWTNSTKINDEIRALKNGIAWSYGAVVVLRGKGSEVTGTTSGREALLLPPFMNKGKFFNLELNEPNTIVLGQKQILDQYKDLPYRFVTIESLTPRQANIFKVPFDLDAHGLQAIKASDSPATKPGYYSPLLRRDKKWKIRQRYT